MPEAAIAPDAASRFVRDELILDGNARLNLATFVTTGMVPESRIVVRNGFSADMADILLSHRARAIVGDLSKLPAPPPISRPQGFHH